jgi:hypothetical protein
LVTGIILTTRLLYSYEAIRLLPLLGENKQPTNQPTNQTNKQTNKCLREKLSLNLLNFTHFTSEHCKILLLRNHRKRIRDKELNQNIRQNMNAEAIKKKRNNERVYEDFIEVSSEDKI